MRIEALKTFAGVVSMRRGSVRDVDDDTAAALIKANYAKAVDEPEKKVPAKPKTAKKK